MLKKLQNSLVLIIATILSILILTLAALAISDSHLFCISWQESIKNIQTFLGGLGVLAASLFAYHANTAMARETRRKNDSDQEILKNNILLKAALAVGMIRSESHARLHELYNFSQKYKSTTIEAESREKLILNLPNQWLDVWEHLSFLPNNTLINIMNLTTYLQVYINEHNYFITTSEKFKINCHSRLTEIRKPISEFETIIPAEIQEQIDKLNRLSILGQPQDWQRLGHLLENIRKISEEIANALPLADTTSWETPIYPPKPETKNT